MSEFLFTISQRFKNKKKASILLNDIKQERKRLPLEIPDNDFPNTFKSSKRVKIDLENSPIVKNPHNNNNQFKPEDLASKTTVASVSDMNENPLQSKSLSEKTKNILNSIFAKKKKQSPKKKTFQTKIFLSPNKGVKFSLDTKESKESKEGKEGVDKEKAQIPKLSDKTKEIIEKLRHIRKNRFIDDQQNKERELSRSDSSFSLRFKYEELLYTNRELLLPTKYKSLLLSFISLDQMINLNKVKSLHQVNTFNLLQSSIESSTHRRFDLKTFQQILYVVPHLFIYKYEKRILSDKDNKIDYDLIIDIPSDHMQRMNKNYPNSFDFHSIQLKKENFNAILTPLTQSETNKRKTLFKNILYEIVNSFHKKFLKDNNIIGFNPFGMRTWHHNFDLEKCEEIPIFEISPKPLYVPVFEKVIRENDIKSQLMKDALDLTKYEESVKETKPQSPGSNNYQSALSKYVSNDFINRIKAKENVAKYSNEIMNFNRYVHTQKNNEELYQEILDKMKTFYICNTSRIGSFQFEEICEKIINSSERLKEEYTIEKIGKIIKSIAKRYPKIIKIKNHSQLGLIVIMNVKEDIPKEIDID